MTDNFYQSVFFNQNLKTSNFVLKIDQSSRRFKISFSQFHTFKKNFLFKISTIRTKKYTDIRYNSFQMIYKILSPPVTASRSDAGADLICKNYEYCLKRQWNQAVSLHRSPSSIRTKFFNQTYSFAKNLTLRLFEYPTAKPNWRGQGSPEGENGKGAMNQRSKDWIFQSKTRSLFRSIFYLKKREHYLQKSDQIFQNIWFTFQNYEKSNQNTYFYQRPVSYPLQWIQKGDLLGDCAASTQGELALGKNLLVAYMPWEGFNFEDAVLINNKVLSTYTSLHIEKYDLEISETSFEKITNHIPGIPKKNLLKLDKNGIVQIGSWVKEGDILVGKIAPPKGTWGPGGPTETQTLLTHEKLLYDIVGQKDIQIQERCLRVPQGSSGRIIRITYTYLKRSQNRKNSLPPRSLPALSLTDSLTLFPFRGPSRSLLPLRGSLHPLSESSLTKFQTKVQTGPKLALAKTSINNEKQTFPSISIKKFIQLPLPYGQLSRSFFPFFVQNLQSSYFMRKSFRHFCQYEYIRFCIFNLGLCRNRNEMMAVFEKMYNNWPRLRVVPSMWPERHKRLPVASPSRFPLRGSLPSLASFSPPSAAKALGQFNIYISSYMRKNKKFVTIVYRWLWLYKSLVPKNNSLFIGIKHFYKTKSKIQLGTKIKIPTSTRLDQKAKINVDRKRFRFLNLNRIFNKRFCFDGSIKPYVQPGLQLVTKNFVFGTQTQWPYGEAEGKTWSASQFLSQEQRGGAVVFEDKPPGKYVAVGQGTGRQYKNFISIKQRNFQKVVFEKPNYPIQTPKIIPRISTIINQFNGQQTFQKNQNRLRQQSQTKLLRTKRLKLKNIYSTRKPLLHRPSNEANQLHLPLNAFKKITIYIAEKREFQVGDKISGRHGNKGIISQIFSNYDMPYLASGDTLDVLLNPLGVPSRMNVGQILECLLGFTGQIFHTKFQILCFDEIYGYEASRSFIYSKLLAACQKTRQRWLFSKKTPGKLNIFDGRNGQLFHQSVMVGSTYLMKLIHIVDEKIHARGTGPYSLITQQPLRGRAKHGGQRFGEMEVWALQGFGSAYTLQELLTVKSDDLQGRNQIMQTLLKNTPLRFGTPESLRVVLRELQCLCLDLQLWGISMPTNQA